MNKKWVWGGALALLIATVMVKPAAKSEWEDPGKSQLELDLALIDLKSSPIEENEKRVIEILEKIDPTIRKEVLSRKYGTTNQYLLTYAKGLKSPAVVKKLEDLGATINWDNEDEAFAELDRLLFDELKETPAGPTRTKLENEMIAALGQISADRVIKYYETHGSQIEEPANKRIIDKFDEIITADWKKNAKEISNALFEALRKADTNVNRDFYEQRFITLLGKVDPSILPEVFKLTKYNKTLIFKAMEDAQEKIVDALETKGANIDWSNAIDVGPKFYYILTKKPDQFTATLKKITSQPDEATKSNLLLVVLSAAIMAKNTQAIEELIKLGVDINGIIPEVEFTPLTATVLKSEGDSSLVKFLIDKGAKVDIKDPAGKIALDYIDPKDPKNTAVINLLKQEMAVEAQKNLQALTSALMALK